MCGVLLQRATRQLWFLLLGCCFCCCCVMCVNGTKRDYFSSVSGLEELLHTESVLLDELQYYVTSVTAEMEVLQSEIAAIKREHLTAGEDLEGYINNPVNAYRLIKRLHSDWPTFEESIRNDMSQTNFLEAMQTHRQNLSFPAPDDVVGSSIAMVRLQETYQLDVAQLASGILNGIKYGSPMSWQDCFLLGQQLFELRDFNHTVTWLKQSMRMLLEQEYSQDPLSLNFIEAVATYHHEMGDLETSLQLINHVLTIDPEREHANDVKAFLQHSISAGVKQGLLHEVATVPGDYRQSNEFKLYERVCRGEVTGTPTQQRPLLCKYHTNNVAYRLLQPYKLEEHNLDPYLVQFHEVITDSEIETLKQLAKSNMRRSKVQSVDGSAETTSTYRISKTAWFSYKKHATMQKLRMHLKYMSGLNVDYAEKLQVANYGLGGHYEPHWDFFSESHSFDAEVGNRLATCVYYLSDVEAGGGTAFPFLSVLVKPEKGSALFWYNLHSSEDPDYRTKHAGCPVLKGSKWIANIWVPVRHQFLTRPCDLQRSHEISLPYKDYD